MSRRKSEFWDARLEIEERCERAGLDAQELNTLLFAFEAAVLWDMASTYEGTGQHDFAASLRHMAKGIRPPNWRRLLTSSTDGGV